MNGKTPLTQAQRHNFVDSVTWAGVLLSWWENEEIPGADGNNNCSRKDQITCACVCN